MEMLLKRKPWAITPFASCVAKQLRIHSADAISRKVKPVFEKIMLNRRSLAMIGLNVDRVMV